MPTELLITLLFLAGVAAILYVVFIRATRRVRRRLAHAREAHAGALDALARQRPELSVLSADEGWAALEGAEEGTRLRLTAGAQLRRTTFIRYCTQLFVWEEGRRLGPEGLHLDLANPAQAAGLLQGMPEELARDTARLVSALHIKDGRLVLMARPGGDPSHNYSYGFHLLLVPEALNELWALGIALADRLRDGG